MERGCEESHSLWLGLGLHRAALTLAALTQRFAVTWDGRGPGEVLSQQKEQLCATSEIP